MGAWRTGIGSGAVAVAYGLLIGGLFPAPASAQRVASVTAHDIPAPRAGRIVICHGYGCYFRSPVQFSPGDLRQLQSTLARGRANAEAERRAISAAVQWFERRVGRQLGTTADQPRSPPSGAGDRTQLDCVDHTLNTMHLMVLAGQNGWLAHHAVDRPRSRGFLLDGRYPHSTAVIRERKSGALWTVDSWPGANGEPPEIMPLETWLRAG